MLNKERMGRLSSGVVKLRILTHRDLNMLHLSDMSFSPPITSIALSLEAKIHCHLLRGYIRGSLSYLSPGSLQSVVKDDHHHHFLVFNHSLGRQNCRCTALRSTQCLCKERHLWGTRHTKFQSRSFLWHSLCRSACWSTSPETPSSI